MTATLTHHKRHQLLLDLLKLLAVHGTDLTHTKGNITLTDKLLVILIKNLLRRLILQITSRRKHLSGKLLDLDPRDQRKSTGSDLIRLRTGR